MSQVFSFCASSNLANSVREFLDSWTSIGTAKRLDANCYELVTASNEFCLMLLNDADVSFEGQVSDEAFQLIKQFADSQKAELLLEGEPLEAETSRFEWANLTLLEKVTAVVIGLVLFPLMVLLLPIALFAMVVRLSLFLLKDRRNDL